MAPLFIESRQHFVPGQISTLALPRAKFLVGRVRHDPEKPRAEGGLPPEGWIFPRDPYGEAIGSIAIRDDKMLGCRRLVLAESVHQCLVAVKSCRQASIHLIKTRASRCHGP
jgi:hypothetical protein